MTSLEDAKACVTGGAGFIGSHLVDRLLNEGCEVIVIDNLYSGKLENIACYQKMRGFTFVKCDIRSKLIKNVLKDADLIFHEAAVSSVKKAKKNPLLANSVNVNGTLNLLRAALDLNIERFVYASSAAVYGDVSFTRIKEDAPIKPVSIYGVSKLASENYVITFHRTYGLRTVCLRYFNVYGLRQTCGPEGAVIPNFLESLANNKPLIIYGDGHQTRDFIHVQDVVDANVLAIQNKGAVGEAFNIGTGKTLSINKLADILFKVAKKPKKLFYTEAKSGDIKHSCADIVKAKRILGFRTRCSLRNELAAIVKHTIFNYQST